jgi:multisubunit Na+/H+ antiporter MnhB subunit
MRKKIKSYFILIILGILALGSDVSAQNNLDPEQQPLFRLLREFSVFLVVVLLIFIIFLAISLFGALKYLGPKDSFKNKLKLIWHFFSQEPAQLFSRLAQRDRTGTYLLPYDSYKRLHNLSQKTFMRTLGVLVLQVCIIVFLIFGLSFLSHYTKATNAKNLESNNFILQLDK